MTENRKNENATDALFCNTENISVGLEPAAESDSGFSPLNHLISAVDNTNDMILVVNMDSEIEYLNDYAVQITGYAREEALGKTFYSFFSRPEASRVRAIFRRIAAEKARFSLLRLTVFTKTGEKLTLEVNGVPVSVNSRFKNGYFCILRDISERESAEKELEMLVSELKESIAAKDRFFSLIAHDLKSPFHGMLGLSGILLNEFDMLPPEDVKKYLSHLNQSAKSVYNLVNDLLEWARMQTNHFNFQPQKLTLFNEVYRAGQLLIESSSRKSVNLINNVKTNIWVYADVKMLQSILMGLLNNAIKFSHPGGKIWIDAIEYNDAVQIRIKDQGIGISKQNLEKLFKPDTHYSTLGTLKESGTGLGLILCKDQVERNGGRIWIESNLNAGAEVFFTLPKPGI
jgi:PAS domain S-box-containing protein